MSFTGSKMNTIHANDASYFDELNAIVQNEPTDAFWFGPEAPQGREDHWVQTIPVKGFAVILRLYGPLDPWFDKTWKPSDLAVVE